MKERIIGGAGGLTGGTKLFSGAFGFESISDFLHSIMGVQYIKANAFLAVLAGITSWIGKIIWDSPEAYYTLVSIMAADFISGTMNAIRQKKFQARKLMRTPIYLIVTSAVLAFSWNLSKSSTLFIWLPGVTYGGFCSVYFLSLIDNLGALGFIPKTIVDILKQRAKITSLFNKKDESQN